VFISLTLIVANISLNTPGLLCYAQYYHIFFGYSNLKMTGSDDDEDLELAMAMSLQDSLSVTLQSTTITNTVDLASDNEDEAEKVRQAIALSPKNENFSFPSGKPEAEQSPPSTVITKPNAKNKQSTQPKISTALQPNSVLSSTLSGLDRKAMEQERLARLGKRKRDPSPDRPSKQVAKPATTQTPGYNASNPSSSGILQYPTGAIKRTFATKYPRTDDITLDEVLDGSNVDIAVMSSFMWDWEWLEKKLNPARVKQIWIMNAKGRDVQERWRQEMEACGIPNMRLHFPPMEGSILSMHSKFMLLFGKERLRFVVPTANMTPIDWGEVTNAWQPAVMENSMFLIDLPRKANGEVGEKDDLTLFGKDLVYFLEQQEVDDKVVEGVLKFDFAQTGHLAFVHSM
jgi:hypothetical protein